jgi:hypothetical protein
MTNNLIKDLTMNIKEVNNNIINSKCIYNLIKKIILKNKDNPYPINHLILNYKNAQIQHQLILRVIDIVLLIKQKLRLISLLKVIRL